MRYKATGIYPTGEELSLYNTFIYFVTFVFFVDKKEKRFLG